VKYLVGILILFFGQAVWSQPDTLYIKAQVDDIYTEKNHRDFWESMFDRDQHMMNSPRIGQINIENLFLVSYYLNKFGYPDQEVLGEKATISRMVWVHNKYDEIKKITFPIILQGYLHKTISEFNLRDYYLRILYQRYFEDHGNWTKPLSQIYKELKPNLTNSISLSAVYQTYANLEKYFSQDKLSLGVWKSEDTPYHGELNGSPISYSLSGARVTIYQMPDGKYFFEALYENQSVEPQEIIPLDDLQLTFKFGKLQSGKVFRITMEGDLIYQDENGQKINVYHSVSKK